MATRRAMGVPLLQKSYDGGVADGALQGQHHLRSQPAWHLKGPESLSALLLHGPVLTDPQLFVRAVLRLLPMHAHIRPQVAGSRRAAFAARRQQLRDRSAKAKTTKAQWRAGVPALSGGPAGARCGRALRPGLAGFLGTGGVEPAISAEAIDEGLPHLSSQTPLL